MKFKILFPIVAIVAVLVGGYIFIEENFQEIADSQAVADLAVTEHRNVTLYEDNLKKFIVADVSDKQLQLQFTAKDPNSLQDQAVLNQWDLAVNAGYYRGSSSEAEHIGLLQIAGELEQELVQDSQRQLTQVVIYDAKLDQLSFESTETIELENYSSEEYSLFQTGPLLIKDGEVQTSEIESSINGNQRASRTVLGYTDSGKQFVMVTRVGYSLTALAELLLELEIFADESLSVVNLDGGSSSAIYTEGQADLSFLSSKRLPAVMGFE